MTGDEDKKTHFQFTGLALETLRATTDYSNYLNVDEQLIDKNAEEADPKKIKGSHTPVMRWRFDLMSTSSELAELSINRASSRSTTTTHVKLKTVTFSVRCPEEVIELTRTCSCLG